ncbi:SAM-dependent methyltransferase [Amycolatopsis bartoniae]|uniref:Methyltransferase type 11 n=1 Tax=Amycolatopsis bartoniae TaxID=941986 RepID=A0A8H9J113_9PSEU|nr:class I SAM-dependent methyltransferase [Amycolatopsis bartoniae]MBB2935726.1 SAM-dependent methyltransferase [Amycolatopsis bartoniae]TVT05835.1 class I SAM-dependent methyltransferase [Amycolatopsis bartoniae]GHF61438.1 methyltransferase type 11 [Amycolatopsis bartoniae]
MPTLPSEPHQQRQVAESFGADAERYDRSRPRYPDAMVERIVAASPGRDFLDVGIGTGIAARQFQAAGCRVTGIDPDARMAEWARRSGFEVEVAKIEDWDPAGRTFDAVVAGQAWHWVDLVAGARKAAEVLRPGGRLAVFWNGFQPPDELAKAFAEVYRRVLPDSPITAAAGRSAAEIYSLGAAKAADGMRETGAFGEPEEWRFEWERSYPRDEWLDQLLTQGGQGLLPEEQREQLLSGIAAAIDSHGGRFTAHYTTIVSTAARV